ncbi:hypothetical protein MTR_5g028970 [Medicago truncatula]|uniref:Uncharacterized protein n=1 Tax=Medicago truncatula TaxID=3880 RepID=G7KB13_MEDTR|nr:hypothetical protein MTR_5g028970 [Medicago truncatula]
MKGNNALFTLKKTFSKSIPVTIIDEILGPDKGRINKPVNIKNNSEACRKSEIILSKFWADELDKYQTSDSTLEPDINAERHFSSFTGSPNVDEYLLQLTDTSRKGKRGRPKKTKSPKDISGIKAKLKATIEVLEADSDMVCTRSKSHNTSNTSQ